MRNKSALIVLAMALLCVTSCSTKPKFDPNHAVFDSDAIAAGNAGEALAEHLDKEGLLPPRFEISVRDLKNHEYFVEIRRWPYNGTSISAYVDVDEHTGKPSVGPIDFFDRKNVPPYRPTTTITAGDN